jgi:hypothetical protein
MTLAIGACSDQQSPTEPAPRPLAPSRAHFNLITANAGEVLLCPEGPAGTYVYTVSVTIPANWTVEGTSGTYSAAEIALAEDAAHETAVVSPQTFIIPTSNSSASCQLVFKVIQSINYFNTQLGIYQDPLRLVTITQTAGAPGTQLDSIVSTAITGDPDVVTLAPTTTIAVDPNAFHGSVAAFWNSEPHHAQGCTPGYWKQTQHFDSWLLTGHTRSELIGSVFAVPAAYTLDNLPEASYTLVQGLAFKGGNTLSGKSQILLRAAIAALLNAGSVSYPMTAAQIISAVNGALASNDATTIINLATQLDNQNNGVGGCPLH